MRRKEKSLSIYLIKQYIKFSFLIIVLTSILGLVTSYILVSDKDVLHIFSAEEVIAQDYEKSDITALEDFDGWIEILNGQNQVIYTKGNVLEKKASYTQEELLEQKGIEYLLKQKVTKIAGILEINKTDPKIKEPRYVCTTTYFKGLDGERYLGIVKFPAGKLKASFTFYNPKGDMAAWLRNTSILLGAGFFVIFLMCIWWYAKSIKRHVGEPNKKLAAGLAELTAGNYDLRLSLQAEYEYCAIEESFHVLAQELREAKSQRRQYEKEKQQLFSNIAHDLRTPITTIRGYAKAIAEGVVEEEEKKREYIGTIVKKTDHLNELVELLLIYTKLENSEYQFVYEETDFTEFVREVVIEYMDDFERAEMELELEIPEREIKLLIAKTEIRRVIGNLLINAIKHNPPNTKVRLKLYEYVDENHNMEHVNDYINEHVKDHIKKQNEEQNEEQNKMQNKSVIFEVADNGNPIPEEVKLHMFEPFVSGNESRTSGSGSGLGLSICKKIMEKHHGSLVYKESENLWKCFRISFGDSGNREDLT
ncbi:MAG: HAMP domain-containing sensor histidine kinase [Clostridiales bacterium]|nr:HAMP domain-containing histidine kinase [Clostridiales bacterium]MDU3244239.1 HAMP domain-containing sensor histidine kinase [Clostridiales bacterium]